MQHADILRQRLWNQRVAGSPFDAPETMVRALVGVQSQDYPGARWSVGQRTRDCTDADVARAYDDGKILRTHLLRPTWHFVAPDDIRWILELTAPRVHALNAPYYRKFGLDGAVLARAQGVIEGALGGGEGRTRAELAATLAGAGIVVEGLGLSYTMMHAELEGLICSGANRGKQQTYALLEARAPGARSLPREEALAELTRRFFVGHGPATLKDYVWWAGLSVAEAKRGVESVRGALAREIVGGVTYWFSPAMQPAPPTDVMIAHLLPEYDEAMLAYKDLGFPDLPWTKERAAWHDGYYRPIIIGDARAGTWRRTVGKGAMTLEVNLFVTLDTAQLRALEAVVARYSIFMGLPVALVMGG